jgi:hypothetical protein
MKAHSSPFKCLKKPIKPVIIPLTLGRYTFSYHFLNGETGKCQDKTQHIVYFFQCLQDMEGGRITPFYVFRWKNNGSALNYFWMSVETLLISLTGC